MRAARHALGRSAASSRARDDNRIEEVMSMTTVAAAKATNKTIREKPYQAIGVALGVGVLIGFLVMWSRRDSGPAPEHGLRPGPGD